MSQTTFSPRCLLIVEDDPNVGMVLRRRLEKLEFNVELVSNGQDALRRLRERPVDAVLSDIRMPEMDGMQLLMEMRKSGIEIPMVFLTGYSSADYLKSALRMGATEFLEKPWDDAQLCMVVRRAVEMGRRLLTAEELPPDKKKRSLRIASLLRLQKLK